MSNLRTHLYVCLSILGGLFDVALHLQNWPTIPPAASSRPQGEVSPDPVVRASKQTVLFELGPRRRATRKLPVVELHRYSFDLKAGDLLEAAVDQDPVPKDAIDVVIRLVGPDGHLLFEIDTPSDAGGSEWIYLLAESTGRYEVELDGDNRTGTYRIRVLSIRRASSVDRLNVQAERLYYHARALSREKPPRYDLAVPEYLAAEDLWRRLGKTRRRANALERATKALVDQDLGDWPRILKLRQEALRLFHAVGDRKAEASMLVLIGLMQKQLGDLDRAEQAYQRSLQISARRFPVEEADAQRDLAALLDQRGDKYKAMELYERSIGTWRSLGRLEDVVNDLNSLGLIYSSIGDYPAAMRQFREAEQALGSSGDDKLRARSLARISELYQRMGRLDLALGYARRSWAFRRKAGDLRGQAVSLTGMSLIFMAMGDLDQAENLQQQALSIFYQIHDQRAEVTAESNLGLVLLEEKDARRAIEHFDQSVSLARHQRFPEGELLAFYGKALAEKLRGNPVNARSAVERAVEVLESLPVSISVEGAETSFLVARQGSYGLLIDLLTRSPASYTSAADRAEAFEMSERSRWRTLLESLTPSQMGGGLLIGSDPILVAERRRLKAKIAKTEAERTLLERKGQPTSAVLREQQKLVTSLRTVEARLLSEEARRPAPVSLNDAQQLLDPDTALLEYFLETKRSFLWLVTSSSVEVFELPGRAVIEEKALLLHRLLSESQSRSREEQAATLAKDLSKILLGPVGGHLRAKRLLIVRDGAIHYVPFSVLPDPAQGSAYLLANHQIVYQPSVSVLQALRREISRRKHPAGLLAALGDPVFSPEAYPQLPHTREEVERVVALVPPGEKKLKAVGFDATRDLAISGRLAEYKYLLFATHGQNHPEQPEISGIVLSQRDRQGQVLDGNLLLQDIKGLDLPAELVVLSACKTALGKEVQGEGFVGLPQGFMYAGAARVVVSLWNVNDESNPELITRLFEGIFRKHLLPGEALRAAQLWMTENTRWRSPYYWAGFEIQGEWR